MLRISKSEAQYEPIAKGKDKCRDCRHFRRIEGSEDYVCEKVFGDIAPGGWCKLFVRETRSRIGEAMKHGSM